MLNAYGMEKPVSQMPSKPEISAPDIPSRMDMKMSIS